MKAMVLAAGIGTRLRPLTDNTPKALIKVAGKPMLEIVLDRLKAAGVDSAIVNVFHLAEQIEAFLKTRDFGMKIELSREEFLLDTGGGLKKAGWFFDDGRPFFLHNVDVWSDADLRAMLAAHEASGALATLAVSARPSSRRLLFDATGRLRGRERDGSPPTITDKVEAFAYNGVQAISPEIFPLLTEEGPFSLTKACLRLAAEGRNIRAHRIDGSFWADIGKPEGLEAARLRAQA